MTQYAFGSGTLIGKRTDVANTPPALLGTLESVSLDFDRKVEFLLGQYNMPVAAGGGEFKIAGKIGKVCTVSFAITYPTTSDTSTAQVSGIPSVCVAKNGTLNYVAGGTGFEGSGSTGAVYVALQKNGQSLFFFTSGNPQTNANMSGSTVRGTITYIAN